MTMPKTFTCGSDFSRDKGLPRGTTVATEVAPTERQEFEVTFGNRYAEGISSFAARELSQRQVNAMALAIARPIIRWLV